MSPDFLSNAKVAAPVLDKTVERPSVGAYYEYIGASTTIPENIRNRSVSYRCSACTKSDSVHVQHKRVKGRDTLPALKSENYFPD